MPKGPRNPSLLGCNKNMSDKNADQTYEAEVNNYDVKYPILDNNTRERVAMLEARVRELEEQVYVCLSWMRTQAEREAAKMDPTAKPPAEGSN